MDRILKTDEKPTTIYERIKQARLRNKMSMDELAQAVGYGSRSAIYQVETGQRNINHDMILKYAEALNVSPMWLLTGRPSVYPTASFPAFLSFDTNTNELVESNIPPKSSNVSITDKANFTLIVQGSEMIGAKIFDGDFAFIQLESKHNLKNGDIVAYGIVGDSNEFGVRFWNYLPTENKIVLTASTPGTPPIIIPFDDLERFNSKYFILGRVISTYRKIG